MEKDAKNTLINYEIHKSMNGMNNRFRRNEVMQIKIINSSGVEWYKDCIGKVFKVQSESRKGGKGKYVLRIEKEDRYLMNGYQYGWVDKDHCEIIMEG